SASLGVRVLLVGLVQKTKIDTVVPKPTLGHGAEGLGRMAKAKSIGWIIYIVGLVIWLFGYRQSVEIMPTGAASETSKPGVIGCQRFWHGCWCLAESAFPGVGSPHRVLPAFTRPCREAVSRRTTARARNRRSRSPATRRAHGRASG